MKSPDDLCAYCGIVRDHVFHVWYNHATGHAFVEPASPTVASGDAVVREITERWLSIGGPIEGAVREAYAAGRRDAFAACEAQLRKQADEHGRAAELMPDIAEPQMLRAECLRDEADAIAKAKGAP